ncbi:hypothetical protein HO173_012717 [Letharia columbiana]|uniref:Uncharacterized protein n=1 Tax=Letharia columbiana TaxID=112416 RepID=A0A8H6CKX2_9LECA|nr:uncharacterized protein HO173_012717 [Letharia columbiana]KAF6225437.1 hypothetical protein HO173_012717 [Letharia columbiana]
MPVLHHRHSVSGSRQLDGAKQSIKSNNAMADHLWILDETYERPEKERHLLSTTIGRVPSKKENPNHLRIDTYSKANLHDRYMSSEEEPSPSPDSDTESNEEELKHKVPEKVVEATTEPVTADEYEAEIAIAVPILAMGKPKLVDITNLAPMHKRKRAEKSVISRSLVKNATLRMPTVTDENRPLVASEATKIVTPEAGLPTRKASLRSLAPDSWLPDDGVRIVQEEEEEEDEHYFPDLELRKAPTYNDYDPYSLSPPRLSPRNSYNSTSKKPGSVARARNTSNPPTTMNSGWKGLTRSMSLAKKQALHRADHQVSKKPKMIARAADEREEPLIIPAFPFGDGRGVD